MEKKASVLQINDLNVNKVSKQEFNFVKGCIENINDRMKELSVVQSEITQILIPFKGSLKAFDDESKQNFISRVQKI